MSDSKYTTVHYNDYLGLEKLLDAQKPRSADSDGRIAHEEMLFIIVHQSYELWFKQIIHELESVLDMFADNRVDEREIGMAINRLRRVRKIVDLLIDQLPILETMTSLDFLDFRSYLFPASGFQSFQFRMIENLLGLPDEKRLTYNGCPYFHAFGEAQAQELQEAEQAITLFGAMEDWLERTPFIQYGDWDFLKEYEDAVGRMLIKEEAAIRQSPFLSEDEIEQRLRMLGSTGEYFRTVLSAEEHAEAQREGRVRLSYRATVAALFIHLYRDEPILHLPFQLLSKIKDIDQALTGWRHRHAQMVLRMLGNKIGTGGSSGHQYLHATSERHSIFGDLHNISTLLIPRSELPELPADVRRDLGYHFVR